MIYHYAEERGGGDLKKICIITVVLLLLSIPAFALAAEPDATSFFKIDENEMNFRFQEILDSLKDNGFGESKELQVSKFKGYMADVQKLFNNTYGNLSETLALNEPKIPENFLTGDFMKESMSLRDELFADVKQSEVYKTVAGKMNIDSVWSKAQAGLPSVNELFTNSFQNQNMEKGKKEYSSAQDDLAQIRNESLDLFTKSGQTLSEASKDSFWRAVENVQDIIGSDETDVNKIFGSIK